VPVEIVGYHFFWNFTETENSCCVPRFPLMAIVATKLLTAKLHSRYAKEQDRNQGSETP